VTASTWTTSSVGGLIDGLEAGVSVRSDGTRSGGPFVLKTSSIASGRFDPSEAKQIVDADVGRARCSPERGSVLISRMNTPALVGEVGYVDADHPELFLPDRLWLARSRRDRPVDMRWLNYYLSSTDGSQAVRELATGTSGSMKNIPKHRLLALEISLPPAPEQRAIASALGDVDELIASLERLIAKKEAIKQGMMQELLAGNTRLSGFTEAWSTHKLSQLGVFLRGRGIKRSEVRSSGVACIRYGELYTVYRGYTSSTVSFVSPAVAAMALPLRQGDLLFAGSGETREEIGMCVAFTGAPPAVAGGDIVVLRAPDVNPVFLSTLTNTPKVAAQKARFGQGDAVVHIGSRGLGSIEVDLPSRDEQDAIAQVFIDADKETRQLEAQLVKVRNVRRGMMQELLTGRTRLPVAEAIPA
jgi:type I restriction enzyme, S subunit